MRIAIISSKFPPRWLAGTEIATYNIAKRLAKNGHQVHVVTSKDIGLLSEEIIENFTVHRIYFQKIRFIGFPYFWSKILVKIKKLNPDIIHVQSIGIGVPAFFARVLLNKPYVVWGQGSDIYLPNRFIKWSSKTILRRASLVIALSEDMKKKMNKIYSRDDIIVLPNGIELERFGNISLKWNQRNKKTILFVGTLRPVKGVRYMIEAMKIIKEKSPGTRLNIIGDGPDREKLETLVHKLNLQDCICFRGRISNTEIPRHMTQSDLFVLPSLSESFGIVNIEAMASGLPIVTTNVGGLPEIVKNGVNGFLVEPKNPEALAEKILLVLNDKDLWEKISVQNIETASEYSWNKVVHKLEKAYNEHADVKH